MRFVPHRIPPLCVEAMSSHGFRAENVRIVIRFPCWISDNLSAVAWSANRKIGKSLIIITAANADMADVRQPGALVAPGQQLLQGGIGATGDDFDIAVRQVADEACEVQFHCLSLGGSPKADGPEPGL